MSRGDQVAGHVCVASLQPLQAWTPPGTEGRGQCTPVCSEGRPGVPAASLPVEAGVGPPSGPWAGV